MVTVRRQSPARLTALRIVGRAIALWWREFFVLTLFNIAWLALQVPIVTGPAATAAMYLVARKVIDGEYLELRDGPQALQAMFVPAWKWGALNLIISMLVVGNFWLYQNFVGALWIILRIIWGTIGLGWLAICLFYWPFWLVQDDRAVRTTLKNVLVFIAKRPGFAIALVVVSAVIAAASILITIPLGTVLMAWLALIGVLAVDAEIARVKAIE
ncbi:MAG: hypothetical protein HY870_12735 [Chloroflexi bacterium]|nr:hypothetical protein [Chloroflexota bacterium]